MAKNDAWADLTNYIISKNFTREEWKRKKAQILTGMQALASEVETKQQKEVI